MGTTADAAIGWVIDNFLGWQESPSSEYIPFQEKWGYGPGTEVEWCGGLWCEAVRETGGTVGSGGTIPNVWWTVGGVQTAIAEGTWIPADGSQGPRRGDLIFFDWAGGGTVYTAADATRIDHVEGCEDGSAWPNPVSTIGGNISEACGRFLRADDSMMVGWIRPRWDAATTPSGEAPAGELAGTAAGVIYRWLRANGLSVAGACGVLGNFQAESNLDPAIVEGGSHDLANLVPGVREGVGLLQWSFSRREDLFAYADSVGGTWSDPEVQLAFMLTEVNASQGYRDMWSRLGWATDPGAASADFASVFVRPGVYGPRDTYAWQHYENATAGLYDGAAVGPTVPTRTLAHLAVPAFI